MRVASLLRLVRRAVVLASVATPTLYAQPHRYFSALEYSAGIPIGDTHDYTPVLGWSGAVWESRWMDHPHTSIGVLLGFNEFYQRKSGTFLFPSGAATGDQYKHLIMAPFLFTGHYYLNQDRDDPRFYVGGGAGAVYTEQMFELGLSDRRKKNWGMIIVPEMGLAFPAWYGTGGIVAVRYHLPSTSPAFLHDGDRRFQYISLSVGLGFR